MLTAAERESSDIPDFIHWLPRAAGLSVLAISTTVLLGWMLQLRSMQSFVPGLVTMKANAALALAFSALSLLLLERRTARSTVSRFAALFFAALVVAIGAGTLSEYIFHADLGLDQLAFSARADAALTDTPGRMAIVSALAFVLIGGALLATPYSTRKESRPASWLALGAGALALTAVLGYVYGVIPKAGLGDGIQIAIHTSIALVLLSVGTLARTPEAGWMPTLLSSRSGGVLARRMLPFALTIPLALGMLRLVWDALAPEDMTHGGAAVAMVTMIAFAIVIWRTAGAMNEMDRLSRAAVQAQFETQLRVEAERHRADAERDARTIAEREREIAVKAEREKADALALLDLMLDSAPIGFAVFDTELRYQRINRTMAAINGAPAAAHIGRTVRELAPDQADVTEELIRRVLATGAAVPEVEHESVASSPLGKPRHWLSSFYPISSSANEILGVGVTVLETTERKRLQEQLHQGQRLNAVGQLAGGVAHDFNNLLTVITSYSGILLAEDSLGAEMREDVSEIKAAADRAAALTRQLLAFSRQQVLQPQPLDLNAVTANVEKLLRRLIRENIELVTALEPELGVVLADPGQVEQVLVNLVVNARDAMPDGGRIRIETANVELDGEYSPLHAHVLPGSYVMLAVSDTGCGMDEPTRARIFEPFFTTKGVGDGTGLGLATVYGIVKQSGGNIWVYSEPGHGSVFKVYLPRAADLACALPEIDDEKVAEGGTETILLVEDESPVRVVARRILEGLGYTVLEAANGDAALRVCETHGGSIDLIVTDMVMPELGGRELASAVTAACPDMRVLFMSGYTEDAALQRSVLQPGSVFLEKPFTAEALARKVRQALLAEVGRGV